MGVSLDVLQVAPSTIGGGYRFDVREHLFLAASSSVIFEADANRTSIVLIFAVSFPIVFQPLKGRAGTAGVPFAVGQAPLAITIAEWGPIVGQKWLGYAVGGNTSVQIARISWDAITGRLPA